MDRSEKLIQRNILAFYLSSTVYSLSASYLSEGYIHTYMLSIGLDTMAIGVYGTCSTLAALLGYMLFAMYRPRDRKSYVRSIVGLGLLGCALPAALIGANYAGFAALLLYAGAVVYGVGMAMKTSCEFSAIPMLFPRMRYGGVAAKCGLIGSGLAALVSVISAPMLSGAGAGKGYTVFFALAGVGLLVSALAARMYTPMEALAAAGEREKASAKGSLRENVGLLLPHFLRGVTNAFFYYFVTVSLMKVTLSPVGQTMFVTVGVVATMSGCGLFMKLQERFRTGMITLWSNVVTAAVAVITCFNSSEPVFFVLYVVYMLTTNVTANAIPTGVMYCTSADRLPFISSMRLLVMSGATTLLLTPVAGLVDSVSPWLVMAVGAALHIVTGLIFAVQYTDYLKTENR